MNITRIISFGTATTQRGSIRTEKQKNFKILIDTKIKISFIMEREMVSENKEHKSNKIAISTIITDIVYNGETFYDTLEYYFGAA